MLDKFLNNENLLPVIAGNFKLFTKNQHGITIETPDGIFDVTYYTNTILRIHRHTQKKNTNPYSVIQTPDEVGFSITENKNELLMASEKFDVRIQKEPLAFTFMNKSGEIINQDDTGLGTQVIGNQVTVYKTLQDYERFVGLGEKTGPLNRRGHGYQHWNTDHFAYGTDSDPIYASIPFYIGIHNGLSYGIFLDNSHKSHINFGASNRRFSSFSVDAGDMDYYFFYGSVSEIVSSYTWLTGRMTLPPLWSIGYQQCRYSYYPESEVLDVANKFREKDIPADVMVLDIHHMDGYKIFTWDKGRFPNPQQMVSKLKELGFETTVIFDPGIKVEEGYQSYDSGVDNDIFVKYPDGIRYEGEVWPGWCHFPDFTKEKTRSWWSDQMKIYTSVGVKGFWNDMNEIATWGQMLPDNLLFAMEGEKTTSGKARNIYGLLMTRSSDEGAKRHLKGQRSFLLTRSGFSGIQRYGALWTGDNIANDDHMLLGVRLVNSLGLSGVAYAGYDVGGFSGDGNSRLFVRWVQLGAFSPFFRGHSIINSRDAEPWAYGEEAEEISRNYIRLRYKLLPYLYQTFFNAGKTGLPVARSLVFNFTDDEKIYLKEFENQYLFGDSILVAPIKSDQQFLKVYLPKGEWLDFFTDQKMKGRQEYIKEYSLEHLPLFVKSSAIIPVYPTIGRNTSEIGNILELHLYYGSVSNKIQYYEDDGVTHDFEKGIFHQREIHFDPPSKSLKLTAVEGSYISKMKLLRVVLHGFELGNKHRSFKQKFYSFVEPVQHFDPFVKEKTSIFSPEVWIHQIEYKNDEMIISW